MQVRMSLMGQCRHVQPEVIFLPYYSDNIMLLKLELTMLAQLPGQRAPRVHWSPYRMLMLDCRDLAFMGALRIQTQTLMVLL